MSNFIHGGDRSQTPQRGFVRLVMRGVWCVALGCLLLSTAAVRAAQWSTAMGDGTTFHRAWATKATRDGGFVVAGLANTGVAAPSDAWVAKIDGGGGVVWQRLYGSAHGDLAYAIDVTPDDGYIVAGLIDLSGTGHSDGWLMKLDPNGAVLWQKTFGAAILAAVHTPADGAYIAAGESGGDVFIVKIDDAGSVMWQTVYRDTSAFQWVYDIRPTLDGGYIVAGAWGASAWGMKIDGNGNIVWQKAYDALNAESFNSVLPTADGGYAFAGFIGSFGPRSNDGWIVKTDGNGNIVWQRGYGTANFDALWSLAPTADGGYIVVGGVPWVSRLDGAGNIVWQHAYNASPLGVGGAASVQRVADGDYVLAGTIGSQAALWKIDSSGTIGGCGLVETANVTVVVTTAVTIDSVAIAQPGTLVVADGAGVMHVDTAPASRQCYFAAATPIVDVPTLSDRATMLLVLLVGLLGAGFAVRRAV